MAKSKSFFGLRRGSTKSLTFQVLDGVQITKDRVSEVKNPRSVSQMKQRCFLKTAALGYSAMKAIVDHSFEGYTYGSMSMRRFMKLNTPLIMSGNSATNPKFGYAPYGDSTPNMGQFIISDGSLSPIPSNAVSIKFEANSMVVTYANSGSTVSEFAKTIGCNLGDIATLCALIQNPAGVVKFIWLRLILPTSDGVVSASTMTFESDINFSVEFGASMVATVTFDAVDGITASSAALYGIIRSQKRANGWMRSAAKLDKAVGAVRYLDDYSTALLTYPQGDPYILNGDNASDFNAEPIETFNVTVGNATSAVISGEGDYAAGAVVTLIATGVAGGKIAKWDGVPTSGGSTESKVGNRITFTMPAENVTISFSEVEETVYTFAEYSRLQSELNITCAEFESGATAGSEITLEFIGDSPNVNPPAVKMVNAETSQVFKELPNALLTADSGYSWSFTMPAYNLKFMYAPASLPSEDLGTI